ncbi:TlpA disulfide reductase family protein [Tessaracoccus coleopterorum]
MSGEGARDRRTRGGGGPRARWGLPDQGWSGRGRRAGRGRGRAQGGAPAPNFRAMDIDGQPITLEDYRGRPVWLLFQASWCSICRAELPDVEEASDRIDVVSIYLREDRDVVTDYAERLGLSIRSVPDPIGEISLSYLANSVPTHYFIDADGNVASVMKGALSADEIDAQLEALGLGGAGNPGLRAGQDPLRSRWAQPGQQQGRRCPSPSWEMVRSSRRRRVLSCLASVTRQIHSLRARAVMSSQASNAASSPRRAATRSSGTTSWTVPAGSVSMVTRRVYALPLGWVNVRGAALQGRRRR